MEPPGAAGVGGHAVRYGLKAVAWQLKTSKICIPLPSSSPPAAALNLLTLYLLLPG